MSTFLLYNTSSQKVVWGPEPHEYTVDGTVRAVSSPLVQLQMIQETAPTPDAGKVLRSTLTIDLDAKTYTYGFEQVDAAVILPDEQQSPLWPLQSTLRGIVEGAISAGAASAKDVAQIWSTQNDVESLFSKWRRIDPATLRDTIRSIISPPPAGQLDLSGKPVLAGFQAALLNADHWTDDLS